MRTHFLFLAWLVAEVAQAQPPGLNLVNPPALQAGAETEVRLLGDGFDKDTQLILPFRADVRSAGGSTAHMTFAVKPAADTRAGIYPIRVRTAQGISNLRLVQVGKIPVVLAKEPNDRWSKAQPFSLPAILAGELSHPANDVEMFRFSVKAGQRLTFVTETRRLGLSPDLLIRLRDAKGRELAYRDNTPGLRADERLDHTFSQAGDYIVEVHNAYFTNSAWTNLYSLKVGPFDYAQEVFPLGGRRGEKARFTVTGRDGDQKTVDAEVPNEPGRADWHLTLDDHPGSLPWPLAIGDLPEFTEEALASRDKTQIPSIPWPATVNGRLDRPGQEDSYRLAVKPGQRLRVHAAAYFLGSALDGHLMVYDPVGKKLLAENNDEAYRGQIDPCLEFTAPEGVAEVIVSMTDTTRRGGINFGYRLTVEPGGPDFFLALGKESFRPLDSRERLMDHADTLSLFPGKEVKLPVTVRRNSKQAPHYSGPIQGYDGPVKLQAIGLPPGVTVKDAAIAASATAGELVFTAAANAPRQPFEIQIIGQGKRDDGTVLRRVAERRFFLAEPASTHLPWNWTSRKVICVVGP